MMSKQVTQYMFYQPDDIIYLPIPIALLTRRGICSYGRSGYRWSTTSSSAGGTARTPCGGAVSDLWIYKLRAWGSKYAHSGILTLTAVRQAPYVLSD